MSKIKSGRLVVSSLIIFIVSVTLGFGLSDEKIYGFELPVPLELTKDGKTFGGNIENPSIYCYAKITTEILDESGKVIASEQSKFFEGHPVTTFSFIDTSLGQNVKGFNVIPKIKCTTPKVSSGFLQTSQVPVTVLANDLVVKVYSKTQDNKNLKETYNSKISIKKIDLLKSDEVVLGKHFIGSDRILAYADSGIYESVQHIVVEGNFDIVWTQFPTVVYRLVSETELKRDSSKLITGVSSDLITYRNISIDKSVETETGKTKECPSGEFQQGDVCVKLVDSLPPSVQPKYLDNNLFTDFTQCISAQDKSCLGSQSFAPFYLIAFGGIIIALGSTRKTREQAYGVYY